MQTSIATDNKRFEEIQFAVENRFEERKTALNQRDLYLWLVCNVLIFTSYSYACASCEAKQSIASWSSQQSM